MPEFQSAQFQSNGQGLFSAAEIERMMRVEFERAQRHKYPVVCMLIAVDRLDQLQDLYGYESKDEILQAVIGVLRAATRESDYLGYLQDEHLLAMFPHTAPETGGLLARRLLAGAKKLRFDRDGRSLRISLSIGVAHNRHEGSLTFETLVRVAEEGLAVADAGGGDRFVETELYQLYERKRRGAGPATLATQAPNQAFAAPLPFGLSPGAPVAPIPAPIPAPKTERDRLAEQILEALAAQGLSPQALAGIDLDSIALFLKKFPGDQGRLAVDEFQEQKRQIDHFERRVAKLSEELRITEEELKRIAAMKGLDLGVASIYRSVQGLADEASDKDKKREMMKVIFEANFELKKQIAPDGGRAASMV